MRAVVFILVLLASVCAVADQPSFSDWLKGLKKEAIARGISPKTAAVLDSVEPDPRVLGFDRNQPEFVQSFDDYLRARVTDDKIRLAREKFADNRKTLDAIGEKYGVEPEYIVSFWGLESGFGKYQGKYSVVRSLATLAYDPRRSSYFTNQLFAALRILDEGHVAPSDFVGGWAGAMGQNQFMPSAFLEYAQDFDGDGKKNIWSDEEDVWASIANYLHKNGWKRGAGWGMQVMLSRHVDIDSLRPEKVASGCTAFKEQTRKLSVGRWKSLGVRGDFKDARQQNYRMIIPEDGNNITYLTAGNFDAILKYNCANKYAVSVGMLADLIKSGPPPQR